VQQDSEDIVNLRCNSHPEVGYFLSKVINRLSNIFLLIDISYQSMYVDLHYAVNIKYDTACSAIQPSRHTKG